MEKLRLDKLRQGCVVIQKRVRGWLQRRKFLRVRHAAVVIQRYFRGQQTVRCVGRTGGMAMHSPLGGQRGTSLKD